MPGCLLTLEMTESVLLDKGDETLATLQALRALGIRLAIDDFGTGYSSLSYLHSFPVDILKIDRSFVERLSTGGDGGLVSTILRLGRTMNLETVAEGVEDPQELLTAATAGLHDRAGVPLLASGARRRDPSGCWRTGARVGPCPFRHRAGAARRPCRGSSVRTRRHVAPATGSPARHGTVRSGRSVEALPHRPGRNRRDPRATSRLHVRRAVSCSRP